MKRFDAIVVGVGAVGSAAVYQLARRGTRVVGLDRFPPGHDQGSSHGQTRIIRLAYFEHADYVPLLQRAFGLWGELQAASGSTLYRQVGLLQVGLPDGEVVKGVLECARQHSLDVETLSEREIVKRWPGFSPASEHVGVFERRAGYLFVEECVRAYAVEAKKLGAQLDIGPEVVSWKRENNHFEVRTSAETYQAERLIVAAGAWSGQLLAELKIPFEVRRKPLFWYRPNPAFATDDYPCYLFEIPSGIFYGFPSMPPHGMKVAEHSGGETVQDPLRVRREIDRQDYANVEKFTAQHMPCLTNSQTHSKVCMYTMTPDEHFVVDKHPEFEGLCFAAGLSGHGFKFACVLGEILADLATQGKATLPIELLSATRPALKV